MKSAERENRHGLSTEKAAFRSRLFETIAGDSGTAEILDGVNELLSGSACPDEIRRRADVVTDELCVNIAQYAYGGAAGRLCVVAEAGAGCLRLIFRDEGVAFDPLGYADPLLGEQPIFGGLGIYFVKNLADSVSYRRFEETNELTVDFKWSL